MAQIAPADLPEGYTLDPPKAPEGPLAGQPIAPADIPPGYVLDDAKKPDQSWRGTILPFSRDAAGNFNYFDTNAGVIGALKAPFDWTYKVRTGQIPPDPRNPEYIGGAVDAALTYGPGGVASRAAKPTGTPSVKAMDEAAGAGFDAYRASNQLYPPSEYKSLLQGIADRLKDKGMHDISDSAAPTHAAIQHELDRLSKGALVTANDVDRLRLALGGPRKGPDARAAMQARDELFGYIEKNAPPGDTTVRDAVGNFRQARHLDTVETAMEKTAGLNSAKARGDSLTAEQTRTNIAKLLNSDRKMKGFSDTERALLEQARDATPGINRAQNIGSTDLWRATQGAGAGIGGAGAALYAGALPPSAAGAAMGVAAATIPTVLAARTIANRGARRMADDAMDGIAAQSPLFKEAPNYRVDVSKRDLLTRALIDAAARSQSPAPIPQTYRVRPDGTIEEFL